jgi:hypothetical protein
MPTVWAISIVHWLRLLQNSCTVLPANQIPKVWLSVSPLTQLLS